MLYDATLERARSWRAASLDGLTVSQVADVRDNPARRSFLVGFTTLPELWEISYDPQAEPIFDGLVHDYRMGEGIARSGFLGARRTPLEAPLAVLAIAGGGRHVLGTTARDGGGAWLDLVQLDVRRRIARTAIEVQPSPATAAVFLRDGRELLAVGGGQGLQVADAAAGRVLRSYAIGAVRAVRADSAATLSVVVERSGSEATVLIDRGTLECVAGC